MADGTIPTIILGGSDRRPVRLPDDARDKHPLPGYKGVDLRIHSRPVVEILVERLEASGEFGPIYIAGPASAYGAVKTRAGLIDTNGSVGENIANSIGEVRLRHPGAPVAFATCDILPDVEALRSAMADWKRRAPCDLWFPLIRAPRERSLLGASSWKPFYHVVPERGQPPVDVLPGHILVADPDALRLRFIHSLLDTGYRTRNRSILYRIFVLVGGLVGGILYHDALHVLGGRLPTLTRDTVGAGVAMGLKLRRGRAILADLENAVRSIFVKPRHQDLFPDRRVALPILEGLSLALDIDTEEEAREQEQAPGANA